MARYSEAQKRATAKYMQANYDDIKVRVRKGKREIYKLQAAAHGMSLQGYIISLLEADADQTAGAAHTQTPDPSPDQTEK